MSKRIIFSGPSGVAAVIIPAYNDKLTGIRLGESEETYVARVIARNIEVGVISSATTYKIVDETAIPVDRTFRMAWKFDLSVDMAKAREIWRDKMRTVRKVKFAILDAQAAKASDENDAVEQGRVALARKALRDVTTHPGIDAAATPKELKLVWPSILD